MRQRTKMRQTLDEYYLGMLKLVAGRSTCGRRAVGAILTDKRGHILSTGYNGVPSGAPHCIDQPCPGRFDRPGDTSRCDAVHAEVNCLLQATRLDMGHTMYVSCVPCFTCAKAICNTLIRRIVALEVYADSAGYDKLREHGFEVVINPGN